PLPYTGRFLSLICPAALFVGSNRLCSSMSCDRIGVLANPARSNSDLPNICCGRLTSSGGGGPVAPKSVGEYLISYSCLATESLSPGSKRFSWQRTPFTLMPFRLPKSFTYQ